MSLDCCGAPLGFFLSPARCSPHFRGGLRSGVPDGTLRLYSSPPDSQRFGRDSAAQSEPVPPHLAFVPAQRCNALQKVLVHLRFPQARSRADLRRAKAFGAAEVRSVKVRPA